MSFLNILRFQSDNYSEKGFILSLTSISLLSYFCLPFTNRLNRSDRSNRCLKPLNSVNLGFVSTMRRQMLRNLVISMRMGQSLLHSISYSSLRVKTGLEDGRLYIIIAYKTGSKAINLIIQY